MLDFSRLRTPPYDGDILIEPSVERMIAAAVRNSELLKALNFAVIDTDFQTMRRALRQELCSGCTQPAIVTGHQPELIHAGVWAKHVVAAEVARALDGKAINLLVDNDAPPRTVLEVPTVEDGYVSTAALRYARVAGGMAFENMPRLLPGRIDSLHEAVRDAMGGRFDLSAMPRFLDGLRQASQDDDWTSQTVRARSAVEHAFDVDMLEHRVSRVWFGPLTADLLLNAERFRSCYNASLSEYRVANNVRSPNRPIPDLVRDGDRCETPIWVYRAGEPRRRLFAERGGDRVTLWAEGVRNGEISVGDLSHWERAREALSNMGGYRFRPRALSLTLWARVFIGDLFIHGIGGAKYDRITDSIIRRYFDFSPPSMACVSATLLLNLPRDEADAATLREATRRVRDMHFNPDRFVSPSADVTALLAKRAAAIEAARVLRESGVRDRIARREAHLAIVRRNEAILALEPNVAKRVENDLAATERRVRSNGEARRRDFFFALHDREALGRLRDRLASAVTHRV